MSEEYGRELLARYAWHEDDLGNKKCSCNAYCYQLEHVKGCHVGDYLATPLADKPKKTDEELVEDMCVAFFAGAWDSLSQVNGAVWRKAMLAALAVVRSEMK